MSSRLASQIWSPCMTMHDTPTFGDHFLGFRRIYHPGVVYTVGDAVCNVGRVIHRYIRYPISLGLTSAGMPATCTNLGRSALFTSSRFVNLGLRRWVTEW